MSYVFWLKFIFYLIYVQISFAEVTVLPISCQDKKIIVDAHNQVRLAVANGKLGSQPKAANLQRLMWDDEVASLAKNHASLGVYEHSKERKLASRRFSVGENLYSMTSRQRKISQNWIQAVSSWAMEYEKYIYTALDIGNYAETGHYTQIVWAETQYIGCAVANVTDDSSHTMRLIYVCNYGPAGNILGHTPYELGSGCERLCCAENCQFLYGQECLLEEKEVSI